MESFTNVSLPEGVQRVALALQAAGHAHAPVLLDAAARTALQAADALGVTLGQIAKSIIFRRKADNAAVLVVTSGDQRVDEKKVATLVGSLGRADAAFVKEKTGYSIGGVPPIAHASPAVTLIDRELFRFEEIWAAAGHPRGVFKLSPQDLQRLSAAPLADVVQIAADAAPDHSRAALLMRARVALVTAENVPSPCLSACSDDEDSDRCDGCYRTLDEIAQWSSADDETKRLIWSRIAQRVSAVQP